ncbi:MAG: DoxX family protein [Nannocystaceae bacterium]
MTTLTHPLEASPVALNPSVAARWGARVSAAIAIVFLAFDATLKVLQLAPALEATAELGYATTIVPWLGGIQLACLALYVWPRTAPIGAVLWTGYLGGAIATHARLGAPLLSHTLFPLFVAALLWLPLYLRDPRVRALVGPAR